MSVIGPRPALWNQDVLIAEREKYHANDVKPGLTGWAQINGRDELEIPVKAKLDGEYVEKESLLFDEMRWRVYFMGRWIRHGGTHKPYFLRMFRYGKGRVENKLMDEHILVDGKVEKLSGDLIHYDYKGLDAWLNKHIWYSQLELQMYETQREDTGGNVMQKKKRGFYYKLPMFLRARIYYWYRYYGQLGFLDGKEGKIYIYLQAYWYRFIVDAKLYEIEHTRESK